MAAFTDEQIAGALAGLDGWEADGNAITKSLTFDDFRSALEFMTRAAGPIDEMDHHPEWTNVYNRVDIRLSTHSEGGVTEKDVQLARVLDRLA